jgi:acetylornithine deacetylase
MSIDPIPILEELVAARSDLAQGDEPALALLLADKLRKHAPDDLHVETVPRAEGRPSAWVLACFGTPRLIVNAHLDTVPPNSDWSSDPFVARIKDGRLHALGAADTKGAAAAILAALAERRPKDVGILFSGDEESTSVAMKAFLASPASKGVERAIVCEPTNLRFGIRHRGYVALEVVATGPGGHSSKADHLPAPIGMLAHVAVALEGWAAAKKTEGPPGFEGMCLNLAKLDGGIAFNVIPAQARLGLSLRPPPGTDTNALVLELSSVVKRALAEASIRFHRQNAPFATRALAPFHALVPGAETRDLGFWTEAALLATAGIDAVVMGPGDIAQAHAPDEWVGIDELRRARDVFAAAFRS